ncbi:MAG: hypothetical protein CL938_03115, partial [Deltaproteobacteria bacterium]|nr:hypothetical protein [Deltaproteobacteria bacterium]
MRIRTKRIHRLAAVGLAWALGCGDAPDSTRRAAPEASDTTASAEREEEPSAYAPGARPDVVESPSETA